MNPFCFPRFHNDVGKVTPAGQVAKVLKSRNEKFPEGSCVVGYLGWRTHTVVPASTKAEVLPKEIGDLSHSLALGVLGMTGMAAYFGFLDICQPKEGDVVLVTTAAGAVGSLVSQIAKIKGCKVIAFTGSNDKVEFLKEDLMLDHVFNYKTTDLKQVLKKVAPEGIDCYFDNVGGEFSSTVLWHMKEYGRVSACGALSLYNDIEEKLIQAPCVQLALITKQITMTGFLVSQFKKDWPRGLADMAKWIKEGKLKHYETVTDGFENTPKAFISMLNGKNIGKAVVRI